MNKIKVLNRSGNEIGYINLEEARKVLAKGFGSFHFSKDEYVLMLWINPITLFREIAIPFRKNSEETKMITKGYNEYVNSKNQNSELVISR